MMCQTSLTTIHGHKNIHQSLKQGIIGALSELTMLSEHSSIFHAVASKLFGQIYENRISALKEHELSKALCMFFGFLQSMS